MTDIVKGWTGENLQMLIEILTEGRPFKGKIKKNAKSRFEAIDNANNALAYANDAGVHMEIKTSAENLVDGSPEQALLGYVWCIMRTFMKFGDDAKMNCRDALLAWVRNQTQGYKNVDVKDFGKSWHSGLALCALIHHFRPTLIDFDHLPTDEKHYEQNLKTAFVAANKYFGLDEYLTPQEFKKLDEKAMIVYISEYYAGVAAQRKLDTAAKRIAKLVRAMKVNDKLKAEYKEKSERLKTNLAEAARVMEVKIDNTMAGAQRRLDEFYDYQTKKKSAIVSDYLAVEGIYNQLQMKLADQKRQPFVPPKGYTLPELRDAFQPLEKCEKDVNAQLQAEVRRQQELVAKNKQHVSKFDKLEAWARDELKYLQTKEKVENHGQADYQINCLKEHGTVTEAQKNGPLAEMLAIGKHLVAEHYEDSKAVQEREGRLTDLFSQIDTAHKAKDAVLQDDLTREILREKIEMEDEQHATVYKMLKAWIEEKEVQLRKKEAIDSVRDAKVALDGLDLYKKARSDLDTTLESFKLLGQAILRAEHKTEHSEYRFPKPETIRERETFVFTKLEELQALYTQKQKVLEDDLAREEFREKVVLNNTTHVGEYTALVAWINQKKEYLQKVEDIHSVRDARVHLNMLDVYAKSYAEMTETTVAAFYGLGQKILTAEYKTDLSSYTWPKPEEVKERETFVRENWETLAKLYAGKKAKVDDDLLREMFIEKVLLLNKQHTADFNTLKAWIEAKQEYLSKKEEVTCVRDAATHLNTLSQFRGNFDEMTEGPLVAFKKLGQEVLDSKFTGLTEWSLPNPEEVKERLAFVDGKWTELNTLHASKKATLEDDLAREDFREKLELKNKEHINSFTTLKAWIEEKEAYLNKKEEVTSVRDARAHLGALDVYRRGFEENTRAVVPSLKKLGAHITEAKYSGLTNYTFPTPVEVKERESFVDEHWQTLQKLYATKLDVLTDDLHREEFAERVVQQNTQHISDYDALKAWIAEKEAYLSKKETITSVREAHVQLGALDVYGKSKDQMTKSNIVAFKKLGATILEAKYSGLSQYTWPTPNEVKERETFVEEKWVELDKLAATKLDVLKDDLAREEYREKIALLNEQHIRSYTVLKNWIGEKKAYLERTETIKSIQDARVQINLLDVFVKDKKDMTVVNVAAFTKVGEGVLSAKYERLSQWVFEHPEEVKQREAEVTGSWTELDTLEAAKRKALQEALAREEHKEKLRLAFAAMAGEITRFMRAHIERLGVDKFGYTLKEVEAAGVAIQEDDKKIAADIEAKRAEYQKMMGDLKTAEVTENPYSQVTADDFERLFTEVTAAQKVRADHYAAALEKEKHNDTLCKAFADLAAPFITSLNTLKEAIMASREPIEAQLQQLEARVKTCDAKEGAPLQEIKRAYDAVVAAGIQSNPYTLNTYKDVEVNWTQYKDFLNRKIAALNEELQNKKLRGMTKQQMDEIQKQFNQYDHNKNGQLEPSEFKACLYSLGYDLDMVQVKKIMQKFGKRDDYIDHDGFVSYMIHELGDSGEESDVKAGFKFIAHNKETVAPKELAELIPAEEMAYITEHAPKKGADLDYSGFVDYLFKS